MAKLRSHCYLLWLVDSLLHDAICFYKCSSDELFEIEPKLARDIGGYAIECLHRGAPRLVALSGICHRNFALTSLIVVVFVCQDLFGGYIGAQALRRIHYHPILRGVSPPGVPPTVRAGYLARQQGGQRQEH